MDKKIMVSGDWHGEWGTVNTMINRKNPNIILQAGDYGWWPKVHAQKYYYTDSCAKRRRAIHNNFGLKPKNTKIYWCAGNHEDWDDLDTKLEITEVQPNVFYCPFGSVLTLPTGQTVLFVGGAASDKEDQKTRTAGDDWFPQEVITNKDMEVIFKLDPNINIDIVVSHTVPRTFLDEVPPWNAFDNGERYDDQSTIALDIILNQFKPKYWYSGHFHAWTNKIINGCDWTSLDCCRFGGKWWTYHD